MAKKDEVLKHKELGKVVVKQDNRDDGQKLKDFIKENISSMLGSDGEPDLGKIRDILGLSSLNGYELKFPGKGIANALYSAPIYKELKNIDENKSNKINENFIIKGDNLDALKILAKGYTNKIKMIYIDPPYNTMNNDFIYNDNFRADFDAIARISGLIDESGNKSKNLEEMERIFKGTRTHSAWLCFMYPRLKLARDLLKDDGVIFISIDDNEQANLKLLCDEIFGEENFVACLSIENNPKGRKNSDFISVNNEYALIYAKNIKETANFLPIVEKDKTKMLKDKKGYYSTGQRVLVGNSSNNIVEDFNSEKNYFVYYEENKNLLEIRQEKDNIDDLDLIKKGYKKYCSLNDNGVIIENTYTISKFLNLYKEDNLIFNGATIYEKDRSLYKQQKSLIQSTKQWDLKTESAGFVDGKFDLKNIFSMPKNINFIKMLIKMVNLSKDDIILDFFAGSGTTAHAVMAQNLDDNGNRKFILIQLDEKITIEGKTGKAKQVAQNAINFCKNELKSSKPNISDITIERVKRAKKALNSQMEFSVYEITDEPDIDVEENLFGVRQIINPLDLVTNMLLKSGNEISGKNIECVIENRLYKVGNDYFVLDLLQKDDKELFKVLDKDRNGNVYADIYINCDIEVWLNFYAKFKERLRIL